MQVTSKMRIEDIIALTPMQEGLLFHYLKEPGNQLYFEQLSLEVSGIIDHGHLETAWNTVVNANEMLRAFFRWEYLNQPTQVILKEHKIDIAFHDLSAFAGDGVIGAQLEAIRGNDRNRGFDLQEVSFRVTLCKTRQDRHWIIVSNHHILYDGWSTGILLEQFFRVYHALEQGDSKPVLSGAPHFKEFVRWHRQQDKEEPLTFWRDHLDGCHGKTEMLISRKQSLAGEGSGDIQTISIAVENEVKEKIEGLITVQRTTLAAFFYTAWGILLQRYCDIGDVVFGTTVSGRSAPIKGIEKMVGLFINTIPLRVKREGDAGTVGDLLESVNRSLVTREAFENVPLVDIHRFSGLKSGEELFDSIVVIENYPLDRRLEEFCTSLRLESYSIRESTNYDITVSISAFAGIGIDLIYFSATYERDTVKSLVDHFKRIVDAMADDPTRNIHNIELLSPAEKQQLLEEFNAFEGDYPGDKTLCGLFGEQAEAFSDRCSVVSGELQVTYGELNRRVKRLAYGLREKGIGPGSIAAIMVERSLETFTAILGILEAGAAYLPIDPDYPRERIDYILNDSSATFLLTSQDIAKGGQGQALPLQPGSVRPDNLAYIIYTSGSTGRPKGVMIDHRSIVNTLFALQEMYPLGERDVYLLKTSFVFDVSVAELFGWYPGGGKLAILKYGGEKDPAEMVNVIEKEGVTHINFVPSAFNSLVEYLIENAVDFPGPRYIFLAGEALPPQLVKRFGKIRSTSLLENIYGPTEASIYGSWYSLSQWNGYGNIPIGKPLTNVKLYILDSHGQPQPKGVPGELYIAGAGLARGYLNRPELTAERFIDLKRAYGSYRTYKTGDLCRWMPNGNIQFLGRIDFQVKVRGYRIELGEIENRLLEYEGVREAVVVARERENGEKYLCAYVAQEPGSTGIVHPYLLREYLSERMPQYMVPDFFTVLESLPLTPTGKVDRNALPRPEAGKTETYVSPRNELEKHLVSIWSKVLDVDGSAIGIDDNFFQLGGHSLNAVALSGRIHKAFNREVPLPKLFKIPTIRQVAKFLENEETAGFTAIPAVEDGLEYYPLSPAQERLLVLQNMDETGTVYNIYGFMELDGVLDREKFQDVFTQLIQRHESFRTCFQTVEGRPLQRILENVDFSIEEIGPIGLIGPIKDIIAGFIRPFDMSRAPLIRVGLAGMEEEKHLLMIDMHHIISDGTSLGVFVKEFMALYNGEALPAPQVRYRDFAAWFNRRRTEGSLKSAETYWLKQFEDETPILNLPVDFPRPTLQSFEGAHIDFGLDFETTGALRAFARDAGTTMYSVLVSLFTILLSKLGGQEDIVVGTPVAGRKHEDLSQVVGMFVNTLALRNFPGGQKTVMEFVREVGTRAAEAFEHQEYPFEELVENVSVSRDAGRNPLFDAMFAMLNAGITDIRIPGLHLKPHRYDNGISKFDLVFICEENHRELDFTVEYCTRLFLEASIKKFIIYFKQIVTAVLRDREKEIGSIEIITKDEKQEILNRFNNFEEPFTGDKSIHGLFGEQVRRTPDNIAVVGVSELQLSYRKLDEITDAAAGYLVEKGAVPGNMIGILAERSVEMIIGIIGILKAGCAYVPLNPTAPVSRNRFMLKDCNVRMLLTTTDLPQELPGGFEVTGVECAVNRGPTIPVSPLPGWPDQLAYVIYTSGSTGMPKGVAITHANFCQLIHWGYRHLGMGPKDRTLQNLSYYFDWSVWEIFITLTTGAGLYMVPGELLLNPVESVQFMNTHGITVLHVTPTQYQYIAGVPGDPDTLRYLFIGAEKLTYDLVKRSFASIQQDCRLFNQYGPTEATIISAVLEIHRDSFENYRDLSSVPIGTATGNVCLFVLDRYLNLCPVNIAGELYISGGGVARGYLNNPELTGEKFIRLNRYYGSYRTYKTGDLARWINDGTIEYLGRIDHQVKIRGFRIELGEIENRLLEHDLVKEAVVTAREEVEGDLYLCAYIVPISAIDVEDMKTFVSLSLPNYMVPSNFTLLTEMPLNANGKVDRKTLPSPGVTTGKRNEAPRSETETVLAQIWVEVLEIELARIGLDSNFFEVGGHSLKATMVISKIHEAFDVKLQLTEIFLNPTIRALSEIVDSALTQRHTVIEPDREQPYYPLSSAQKRLYILQQMDREGMAYNMPLAMFLEGDVDKGRLTWVFKRLVSRHESLRTSFHMIGGKPVQRINDEGNYKFQITNYMQIPSDKSQITTMQRDFIQPFDLSHAPLFRVGLVKIGAGKHLLMMDMHHIISDGASMAVMVGEFAAFYEGKELPAPKVHYKDFAAWQNGESESRAIKRQEAYWLRVFGDGIPVLELPCDYRRPSIQSFEGSNFLFEIEPGETAGLQTLADREGATLFMVLLAVYNIFLAKTGGSETVVVGTPVSGRHHARLGSVIGMFVNTLALKNTPSGGKTVAEFLKEVKQTTLKGLENQDYQYEELVEKLSVTRDAGKNPLFDTMLVLQNKGNIPELELPGLILKPVELESGIAKFDLLFQCTEIGDSLMCNFEYCTRLFKQDTIERFAGFLKKIVSMVVTEPGTAISEIEIINGAQKEEILHRFNNFEESFTEDKTIHGLFEDQVEQTPDRVAVIGNGPSGNGEKQITYSELNREADRLANVLQEKGAGPGIIVAFRVERSLEMVLGVLGTLKAGGAYLPIAPDTPRARVDYMLKDSNAALFLTEDEIAGMGEPCGYVRPYNLAYIIYTSGSTGRPKGVLVEHRAVLNTLSAMDQTYPLEEGDVFLLKTAYTFDVSVVELFGWFMGGGSLAILERNGEKDPRAILAAIETVGVTHLNFVPSMFTVFVESLTGDNICKLAGLKYIFLAGEALTPGVVNRFGEFNTSVRLENIYGPTEAAIYASMYSLWDWDSGPIPIGKPLANVQLLILDAHDHLQPIGVPGELHIAGAGLARGYMNRPELTAERFVELNRPYGSYRTYKTGDLAKWLPDGNIEFHGRIDHQVKIRGFRIELGEIENRLLEHEGVKEAVVIDRENKGGEKYLCAYVVYMKEAVALKDYLSALLPAYMVPVYFVELENIPLNPNGKVNRKALPQPDAGFSASDYCKPRTETEETLAEIWTQVLEPQRPIGIDDNFFEVGGHSLKAITMIYRVHRELDVNVPPDEFFKQPTIRGLARFTGDAGQSKHESISSSEKREYYALSPVQKRMYFLQQLKPGATGYNIPVALILEGQLDKDKLEQVFRRLIIRHESLRTSFHMLDGQPVQVVHDAVAFSLEEIGPIGPIKDMIARFIRPFELTKAPLIRVGLIKEDENHHVFIVDIHHIASDGTSQAILIREFMTLYAGESLPPVKLQYKDYARWQNSPGQKEKRKRQEVFWFTEFPPGEDIPVLNLPSDYVRPSVKSFAGRTIGFNLDHSDARALKSLGNATGTTLFMVLLAIYDVFLAKISGQEEIITGIPLVGRNHSQLEPVVGMFVNTLALRCKPAGEKTVGAFLEEVKEMALAAFSNRDFQYEELVEATGGRRDSGRNPLFDTMFVLQNMDMPDFSVPALAVKPFHNENKTAKFDLTLTCCEGQDSISCSMEYCTDLFKEETILRFMEYLKQVVSDVVAHPGKKIAEIDILPEKEKQQLLFDFNDTGEEFLTGGTIYELFEKQVDALPDHPALEFKETIVTFRNFDERANQLANYLRGEKGLATGDRVLISMDRSLELIIALMGVLKAGGAYVPLDPNLPAERLRIVLSDASIGIVISQRQFSGKFALLEEACPGFHSLVCMDDPQNGIDEFSIERPGIDGAENPAYIMYTSGSSGLPKGVLVEHRTIVNTLAWRKDFYDYSPGDVSLQIPPYFFDSSVTDIFTPLLGGARLVEVSEDERVDLTLLRSVLPAKKITHFIAVPAFYNVMVEEIADSLTGVKKICCAGEHFPDELIRKHFEKLPHVAIVNEYGPTENSVNTTAYELKPDSPKALIGSPISNVQVTVRDRYLNLCPIGVGGEMYLSGASLARGYLNRSELTAEKFVCLNRSHRSYKTGDMARWLPGGNLEFLGRLDNQVKIRGIRVEVEEIENHLMKRDDIKDAVVLGREDSLNGGERYLCAYVVASEDKLDVDLKGYLAQQLPEYMIPSCIMEIDAIPFTPTGKIDRKAFPAPVVEVEEFVAPGTGIEKEVAEIWAAVLALEKESIGIDSDFFQLGGHSLKATTMVSRIHKKLGAEIKLSDVFKRPTIRALAGLIEETGTKAFYVPIETAEKKEYYILTPQQERLYILQQLDQENTGYNIPQVVPLEEDVDLERLEKTLGTLIHRHQSLRTSFRTIDGRPVQVVHDTVHFSLEEIGPIGPIGPIKERIAGVIKPFDLSQAPLFRAALIRTGNDGDLLMMDFHHIITDGTSEGLLINEFMTLYDGGELPETLLHYKDYAEWLNVRLQTESIEKQEAFWLDSLSGDLPLLNLPMDFPRPPFQSFEGSRIRFQLTRRETESLKQVGQANGATLYMVLLSVFTILLSKLGGDEDIIIGTPIAGRRHPDTQNLIGMLVNTLPMRNYPNGEKIVSQFMEEVRGHTIQAYENQECQFDRLVEKLSVPRDTGRNPVFDVMFNLLNQGESEGSVPLVKGDGENHYENMTAKFDLNLAAVERRERLVFDFEYCTKLFKKETIESFIRYFRRIAAAAAANPRQRLGDLELLSPDESEAVLERSQGPAVEFDDHVTIHRMFEDTAAKFPGRIALVMGEVQVGYEELNHRANCLAQVLREKGVTAGTVVGLMVERSVEMIVGILGILKAGGAYLPIDTDYPEERIDYMLKDSNTGILLATKHSATQSTGEVELVHIEGAMNDAPTTPTHPLTHSPTQPCYIIYTSGSTGKPKGVILEHRNLVNLMEFQFNHTVIDCSRVLQFTTISFDVSFQEVFTALLSGGQLYLIDKDMRTDLGALFACVERHRVTTLFMPMAFLKTAFGDADQIRLAPPCIQHIVTAGEQLVINDLFRDYLRRQKIQLHNHYGPTEAHVVTALTLPPDGELPEFPSIGKPLMNTAVYILDKHGNAVPEGVAGELVIGGVQVGRGYLNKPALTDERFVDFYRSHRSPLSYKNDKAYKTGDLARYLPDGNIQFLGRLDHQMKIMGYRIEPGEIETQIAKHALVKDAVVIDRNEKGRKYLCAYYVTGNREQEADNIANELREYLASALPDYMVPACFVKLDRIPLNPNGKIHRSKLPQPADADFQAGSTYQAPVTRMQRAIAAVWQEVLALEKVGIQDDFFQLGGNSLDLVSVANKLRKKLDQEIPVVTLFAYPTISSLEQYLSNTKLPGADIDVPVNFVLLNGSPEADGHIFLFHEVLGDVGAYMEFSQLLGTRFNCWGVEADKLQNYVPRNDTVEAISAKYIAQMKQIQPQGPYAIATWSWGGHLALEMALQLEQMGEELSMLAFFDCLGPNSVTNKPNPEFSLETEKEFLSQFFVQTGNEAELETINEMEQLWLRAVEILTGDPALVEYLRKLLIANAMALPDYDDLTGEELIQYLNLNRTHFSASFRYIPSGKINTVIHYFWANQNNERVESWQDHCKDPMIYHEITGDHHSIFRNKEHIKEFAEVFKKTLDQL